MESKNEGSTFELMNSVRYKGLLYFIVAVIAATLAIQVYWNYKNYQASKQQLVNDVQTSLDNAVDRYYTDLAAETSLELIGNDMHFVSQARKGLHEVSFDTLISQIDTIEKGITIMKSQFRDSLGFDIQFSDSVAKRPRIFSFSDSLDNPIETLSSKIIVSFSEDGLSLKRIDSLFQEELKRKQISMEYGLIDTGFLGKSDTLRPSIVQHAKLQTQSKSPYFVHGNQLKAYFTDSTMAVLKRNLFGITLSFLLVAGVVAILFYLLKIIQQQKQLSELKNDLISNITHEFKTPLATMGVALEGIQKFNKNSDMEKTMRYVSMSQQQVEKLNVMVEKLLETATLDSDRLQLQKEPIDLVETLDRLVHNEAYMDSGKRLEFESDLESLSYEVDPFHFENAINNIIDNAVKYGGGQIRVQLSQTSQEVKIRITDSGNSLSDSHAKQLFEKFYRVPKGNTHDVKGFGIGLYYTKKIIEKHQGSIRLNITPQTSFIIQLPHG